MKRLFLKSWILSFCLWGWINAAQGQQATPVASPPPAAMATPEASVPPASPAATSPALPDTMAASALPATPVAAPAALHLKDKFAIGTDSIRVDENSTGIGNTTGTASLTAMDAIWWFSDDSGLDFLVTFSTTQTPGVDFNGEATNYPNQIFGGGLGYRYNLNSPEKGLLIQGLARVTYAHYTNQQLLWYYAPANVNFENGTVNSESYNFILGVGFEYFMPFCQSLSVQSYLAFDAEYRDPDTGLIYLRARWMNPAEGRFMSMDSYDGNLHDPQSLHKYTFVADDPENKKDPTGHDTYDVNELGEISAIQGVENAAPTVRAVGVLSRIGVATAPFLFWANQLLYHVTNEEGADSILEDGVNFIEHGNPEARFGQGFYMSAEQTVAEQEANFGETVLKVQASFQKVLDLTNASVAQAYGYSGSNGQQIAAQALSESYDAIRYYSAEVKGGINWVIINQDSVITSIQSITKLK